MKPLSFSETFLLPNFHVHTRLVFHELSPWFRPYLHAGLSSLSYSLGLLMNLYFSRERIQLLMFSLVDLGLGNDGDRNWDVWRRLLLLLDRWVFHYLLLVMWNICVLESIELLLFEPNTVLIKIWGECVLYRTRPSLCYFSFHWGSTYWMN